MDALAESWFLRGERNEDLYRGNNDKIIRELKAWIVARTAQNEASFKLLWDLFETDDIISSLREQYGTIEDPRIAPFKAKRVKNGERLKVRRLSVMRQHQTLTPRFRISKEKGIN